MPADGIDVEAVAENFVECRNTVFGKEKIKYPDREKAAKELAKTAKNKNEKKILAILGDYIVADYTPAQIKKQIEAEIKKNKENGQGSWTDLMGVLTKNKFFG